MKGQLRERLFLGAEATGHVVIHQAHGLHEGVADRRTHETEPPELQVPAQDIGEIGPDRDILQAPAAVPERLPARELPKIPVKTPELFLHPEERLRVLDRGSDLEAVTDDPRIRKELPDLGRTVTRHLHGIKTVKDLAVVFALLQNGKPTQARLRAFQDQELEEPPVLMHRHSPFPIVIRDIDRIRTAPPAAFFHHLSRSSYLIEGYRVLF